MVKNVNRSLNVEKSCVVNEGINPPCVFFKDCFNNRPEITLGEGYELKQFISLTGPA
jgi:hypothetical protein